ncbi:MAG: Lrp/AsnC ligand binding domain-containing protein [bacterium]
MSTGALILARLSDPEKLLSTAEFLERSEFVECWNAVDGHVDLVAKIKTSAANLPEQFQTLAGIDDLQVYDLTDESGNLVCNPELSHAFLFLDIQPDTLNTVKSLLRTYKNIIFCSQVNGTSELIAVLNGTSFQEIDQIVNRGIRTIDGVLRVKQDRVINLKQI